MNIIQGDLWSEVGRAALILFTANATVDRNECLVMGAGSALEAKQRYPHLPSTIGRWLLEEGEDGREFYLWTPPVPDRGTSDATLIGALQTKRHWRDPADLALIDLSLVYLRRFAGDHPSWRIALPFPGIGAGRLSRDAVLPLLDALPGNVWVYERSEKP